jgi:predicted transposase/invertase (TIGR01784 family)
MSYVTNAERFALREAEEQVALEIAQRLLARGMEIEDIADITNLSIEQIQQLQISLSESSEN